MRHLNPGRLLLTATAIFCLAFAAGSPSDASARNLETGVSFMSDPSPVAFEHVAATGSKYVHSPLLWGRVAPKAEPAHWDPTDPDDSHYDWRAVDAWVVAAVSQGLVPILQVSGAPKWAQGCAVDGWETAVCDPSPAKLAAFAQAASRRYSGGFGGLPAVRYWQGLNEPNLSILFNPQFRGARPVAAGLYRKLINAFYFAVKSGNPQSLVLAAGLGPIARPGATIGPMRFTRELLCMAGRQQPHPSRGSCEGGVHFDIFDIHPYTTGGPTHQGRADDVQLGDLSKLQALLEAADRAHRIKGKFKRTPLWITEFSWDSSPPDPGGLATPVLKRWTAEALYQAWAAGVDTFLWFSLRDELTSKPSNLTLESGLYFRGGSLAEDRPKPHMWAFRFPFVAYSAVDGFSFWGRTPTRTGGKVTLQVFQRGGWVKVKSVRANAAGIFTGNVKTTYGIGQRGRVKAVYRQESSIPFSLQPVKDFYQPPFGKAVSAG